MKRLLSLLLLLSVNVNAADVDATISATCLKQAVALAQQLKTDVFADMSQQQIDKVVSLSTDACKKQFAASGQEVVAKNADAEAEAETEQKSSDWFTEKVLNGEPSKKAGNARLKKLRNK